jgi:hypothetical protein
MREDNFSQDEELAAKQQMLANAKKHLRDIQVRISEFPLAENIPLELKQNKRRLELQIARLEKEIAAMSAPVEQQAQFQAQESAAAKARQRALATLTLEGDIGQFDEKERESLVFTLSRLLGVTTEEITIKRVVDGSIKIELELPEEAALKLEEMYRNNDPALEQIGARVQGLEVEIYEDILVDVLRSARALALALTLDRNFARDLALALALDLARARVRARVRAHDLDHNLFEDIQHIAEAELGAEHPEVIAFSHAAAVFESSLQQQKEEEEARRGSEG